MAKTQRITLANALHFISSPGHFLLGEKMGNLLSQPTPYKDKTLVLYTHLANASRENICSSPISLYIAMAMALAGARGKTREEIARAMGFELPQDAFHYTMSTYLGAIVSSCQGERGCLYVANSAWYNHNFQILGEYAHLIESYYHALLQPVNFALVDEATKKINQWVKRETREKITHIISNNQIDASTFLVLVNAIYFHAFWRFQFDPSETRTDIFFTLSGNAVQTRMMTRENVSIRYVPTRDYDFIAIPYANPALEMWIILPGLGYFSSVESNLSMDLVNRVGKSAGRVEATLTMPKFHIEQGHSLVNTLRAMGIQTAFSPTKANFSGMGMGQMYISDVIQKVYIDVSETGTEAAAVTSLAARKGIAGLVIEINRPFLFFVVHTPTEAVLFAGRVTNPCY